MLDDPDSSELTGIPAFPLTAFRQRCILVRADSPLTEIAELRAARIGLTGWPDSGNVWTRSLLDDAGVDAATIEWVVGPLYSSDSSGDRLGPYPMPGNVRSMSQGDSLTAGLLAGDLDAIFTPTLPGEIYGPEPTIRHLLPDYPREEQRYYEKNGFVPPIHVIAVKKAVAEVHPWLASELVDLFRRSFDFWLAERKLLLDTTPWMAREMAESLAFFPEGWNPHGGAEWERVVTELARRQEVQGLARMPGDPLRAFAHYRGAG
jgi:4,5-dihydroxyphthalate decarboxylase